MKKTLTDRAIKALKPAKAGLRYEVHDALVPGLIVRVTATGRRTFCLIARYPGSKNPTRRAIAEYGAISLEKARDTARDWLAQLHAGKDPRAEQEKARKAELRKQAHTFGSVCEAYFASAGFKKLRTARVQERDIRRELLPRWDAKPVTEITRSDVTAMVKEIARRAPHMARLTLAYTKALFNWAVAQEEYGLETSPCERVKPKALIGTFDPRERVLTDKEIAELWHACSCIGYPFGPLTRLMLLTGVRREEAAGARWSEIDHEKNLWTIPPERFKSKASHLVPLLPQTIGLLEDLPRFKDSDFVFTRDGGRSVSGFSKAKDRLDQIMAVHLKPLAPWRLHDIRRTVRTRLASLNVPDTVAEAVIGHGKRGLQRVYDQHSYEPEMRKALELWAARLRDIVVKPPANVTKLRKAV